MAINGYYNRYDPKKHYKELLFIAGRGLQSAELNELQAYIREDLGEIASSLIKEGGLLFGGDMQYDKNTKTVTLEEAKILHKKVYVATAPATTITLSGTGKETVGIAVKEETITELEDPELRDPAVGLENFNQPGAVRKKISARWALDSELETDETFYPVYEFVDGSPITTQKTPPELAGPIQLIARYDYGANGSYVVKGLITTYDSIDQVTNEIILSVSEGTAHVEGFEVTFPYARKIRLSPPIDTKEILAEPHTFSNDGVYNLRYSPIAELKRITGVRQETVEITHGNYSGAKDKLPHTPVVDVLEVRQGDTVFVEGTDYILSGDYIDWSLNGDEPDPGSAYVVVYRYQDSSITASITEDRKGIIVSGLAEDTIFYVDYEYYLPRIDRVVLTREGDLKVLKGVASEKPVPPDVSGGLSLARVKVFYGQEPEITPDYYRAFKMADIQFLFDRIRDIEYNIARLSLIENVRSQDPTTTKKNIFVDPFYDDDLRDKGYEQTAVISNGILIPGVEWETIPLRNGKNIQLPYSAQVEIAQEAASRNRKVNKFTWSDPVPAIMTVTPRTYRWIDRTVTEVSERRALAITMGSDWWNWEGRTIDTTASSYTTEISTPVDVPQIQISLTAQRFNAGETVEVHFDGKLIKLATADENGILNTSFTIPEGTKSGNKQVLAIGQESGVRAEAVVSFIPLEQHTVVERLYLYNEPIAQTFTPLKDIIAEAVEIYFSRKPQSGSFVDVFICETQVGLPDRSAALTRARLYSEDIVENGWTRFTFEWPVHLLQGREYALVVETPDPEVEVKVARLGDWDSINKRWLTAQAYDVGVLLESANSSTWTPIQEEDLTFRLYARKFSSQNDVELGEISVTDATDIVLNCGVDNPAGCSVSFKVTLPDGTETVVFPYEPLILPKTTGNLLFSARLMTENQNLSPTIDGDIYISIGKVLSESTYISRAFPVDGDTLNVYLECLEVGNKKVKVYCQVGTEWVEMVRQGEGMPVGDGFVEYQFTKTGLSQEQTRIKIILEADGTERTAAKNLRAVVI